VVAIYAISFILCLPLCPTRTSLPTQVHSTGDWWEAPPDSAYMRMAERALQREWGVQPLLVREGEPAGWAVGNGAEGQEWRASQWGGGLPTGAPLVLWSGAGPAMCSS